MGKKILLNKNEITKYYIEQNHNYKETCSHFKCGEKTFFKFCKINNIKKNINLLNVDQVTEYYVNQNHSFDDSCNHFKCSRNLFLKFIYQNNLTKDTRYSDTQLKLSKDEIIKYYIEENHSMEECLLYFNCSKDIFSHFCKKNNIKKDRNLAAKHIFKSRHDHNTLNTSTPERELELYLKSKFSYDDVIPQYNRDSRYPFMCDFYIKSKDLFIELNLFCSHGGHPFNPNNSNDIKILSEWKKKSTISAFYSNMIKTWTVRDPLKLQIAKENKLNYIMIYNKADLNKFKLLVEKGEV